MERRGDSNIFTTMKESRTVWGGGSEKRNKQNMEEDYDEEEDEK